MTSNQLRQRRAPAGEQNVPFEKRPPKGVQPSAGNGVHSVGTNVTSWNQEIDKAAKAVDPGLAEQILQRMEGEGVAPDVVTYNSLIHACAKAGSTHRAEKWLARMKDQGVDANA